MLIFLFLCSLVMCYLIFLLSTIFESNETSKFQPHKYGSAMGLAGLKDGALCPVPVLYGFVLPHLHPTLHVGKSFLAPSLPLGALWSPAPSHKTLRLVDLSTTITNFFNKTHFINKNILEITNKFISSN